MPLKAQTYVERNIQPLAWDIISSDYYTGFSLSDHAEKEIVSKRLMYNAAHSYHSINQNSGIVAGGKFRDTKRLPKKLITCSKGFRKYLSSLPILLISSLSINSSTANIRLSSTLSHLKQNSGPVAPLKRHTQGKGISLQQRGIGDLLSFEYVKVGIATKHDAFPNKTLTS